MTTIEKINSMNLGCYKSISFTYFSTNGWEIRSYADGSVFSSDRGFVYDKSKKIAHHDFDAFISKAYDYFIKKTTTNA